jgi:hypothetical protein
LFQFWTKIQPVVEKDLLSQMIYHGKAIVSKDLLCQTIPMLKKWGISKQIVCVKRMRVICGVIL